MCVCVWGGGDEERLLLLLLFLFWWVGRIVVSVLIECN